MEKKPKSLQTPRRQNKVHRTSEINSANYSAAFYPEVVAVSVDVNREPVVVLRGKKREKGYMLKAAFIKMHYPNSSTDNKLGLRSFSSHVTRPTSPKPTEIGSLVIVTLYRVTRKKTPHGAVQRRRWNLPATHQRLCCYPSPRTWVYFFATLLAS